LITRSCAPSLFWRPARCGAGQRVAIEERAKARHQRTPSGTGGGCPDTRVGRRRRNPPTIRCEGGSGGGGREEWAKASPLKPFPLLWSVSRFFPREERLSEVEFHVFARAWTPSPDWDPLVSETCMLPLPWVLVPPTVPVACSLFLNFFSGRGC
jgi:hypothetical protein